MEYASFVDKTNKEANDLAVIYTLPDTSDTTLAEEMADFMEYCIIIPGKSIHKNYTSHSDATLISEMPDSFNLSNKVLMPTHCLQNSTDVVLTDLIDIQVTKVKQGSLFSDHFIIAFGINHQEEYKPSATGNSEWLIKLFPHLFWIPWRAFISQIYHSMEELICVTPGQLAWLKTRRVTEKLKPWWFTNEIGNDIQLYRKVENMWKNENTKSNEFLNFYRQCKKVSNRLDKVEKSYYIDQLQNSKHNHKEI